LIRIITHIHSHKTATFTQNKPKQITKTNCSVLKISIPFIPLQFKHYVTQVPSYFWCF